MVLHLSWVLQNRGSGVSSSFTFGYSCLKRSIAASSRSLFPAPAAAAAVAGSEGEEDDCGDEVVAVFEMMSKVRSPADT